MAGQETVLLGCARPQGELDQETPESGQAVHCPAAAAKEPISTRQCAARPESYLLWLPPLAAFPLDSRIEVT